MELPIKRDRQRILGNVVTSQEDEENEDMLEEATEEVE